MTGTCVIVMLSATRSHAATRTIKILALRVEFPRETPDDFTTGGNGRFDMRTVAQALTADGDSLFRYPFDPPPHDGVFFENHLKALRNYVRTASRGDVDIEWDMFPRNTDTAYEAPQQLALYGSGATTQQKLVGWVSLLRDALAISSDDVDSLAGYESFLIFNASIALQGVISSELPPLILTPEELLQSGVALPPEVTSAWYIPQQIQIPGGVIGLNGSIAKTFLASLGLPVLSNTLLGGAAVGAWTLMDIGADALIETVRPSHEGKADPDSIVVLSFVPGLPMAWEQMRLGWLEPLEVRSDTTIPLANLAVANTTLPHAIKIPITGSEYLLLELRRSLLADTDRHPRIERSESDTSGVWMWPDNNEYDAYSPGSGVLVFHVDDDRIARWEPRNLVSAYPATPSIFLVEADGYRDIGVTNYLGHPRASEGIGSKNDPYPVSGERTLYAWGDPAPGHQVSLANDGTHTGIEVTFAPCPGAIQDSVLVTIRWKKESGGESARFATRIGAPIVGGVTIGSVGPDQRQGIVVATADGGVYVFDSTLQPYGSVTGRIDSLVSPAIRKPRLSGDGSFRVVTADEVVDFSSASGSWVGLVGGSPPSPDLLARPTYSGRLGPDRSLQSITLEGAAGTDSPMVRVVSVDSVGNTLWNVDLGDPVYGLSLGDVDGNGLGDVIAVQNRRVTVLDHNGLHLTTYQLGVADSIDAFTGPAVVTSEGVLVPGRTALYRFVGISHKYATAKYPLPGNIRGGIALYEYASTVYVATASTDGWLSATALPESGETIQWGQLHGDGASSGVLDISELPPVVALPSDLMPRDRAFCYPSPAGTTPARLRFFLSDKADIRARVYTSVGELVWEQSVPAVSTKAASDNEIVWPAGSRFASGLYLCHIRATTADGRSSSVSFPVGIVK